MGAAGRSQDDRNEVWMRYGALRRLYGSHRRRGDTILHHHGRQCRGGRSDYYRSHRRDSRWREGAAGLARSGRRSVRILSVGADHGGSCAAGEQSTPDGLGDKRRDVRQRMPMRHLQSHSSCHKIRERGRALTMRQTTDTLTRPVSGADEARVSRRAFLKVGATAAGGLALAVALPSWSMADGSEGGAVLNAFVRIEPNGRVRLTMPSVEMGQGVYTSLSMLLAEELEVKLDQIEVEHAPPNDALYANPILQYQATGMSTSIRGFWLPLRRAGAAARLMVIAAAARRWKVDPAACTVKDGVVLHPSGARSLPYRDLLRSAAESEPPALDRIKLKEQGQFSLIGTSPKRLEAPDKISGRTQFGIDVMLPGLKVAAIAISPVLGGRPKAVNQSAALAIKGVHQVVAVDEAVAVVADHMGAAKKGLEAAAIQWDDGPNASIDSKKLVEQLKKASESPGVVARNEGHFEQAFSGAARRLDAVYELPFLAHAAMEPMNCTVHYRKDICEIWVGTQQPTITQAAVATLTGIPKEAIVIHNQYLGGGFGRRLEPDGTLTRGQNCQADRRSRQGDLEPRGGHPARCIPTLLLRSDIGGSRRGRKTYRVAPSGMRLFGRGPVCSSPVQKRFGFRCGRRGCRAALRNFQHSRRIRSGRTARHCDRVLAWCRTGTQRLHRRELHG